MANFINAIVSNSNIHFLNDREEQTFKKKVRDYFKTEFGDDRFEYDKPISPQLSIKFNVIKRSNTGMKLINFVSGSNSSNYANSLCRSNTDFQIVKPLMDRYCIKKTITLLDDSNTRSGVMESPQVRSYLDFLNDTKSESNNVILWKEKQALAEAVGY